jgi:hypothetical protein
MKKTLFLAHLTVLLVAGPAVRPSAKAAPARLGGAMQLWQRIDGAKSALGPSNVPVRKGYFEVFTLDEGLMQATLANAPEELTSVARTEDYRLAIPMPDGSLQSFRIWESPIMEPALAAEHPEIKTFIGQGVEDPTATARIDHTPLGFHAQILSADRTVYVDPYRAGDTEAYISYNKKGLRLAGRQFQCLVDEVAEAFQPDLADKKGGDGRVEASSNGTTKRTYRLALACTGEYATAVCNHNGVAVNVTNTFAAMTTTMNRVNGVYERDLSIHMNLVANDTSIVYTNASTDPYTNSNASSLLTQNQSTCDSVIGSANYDIGHVFSTGGGGLAGLGVVCSASRKAQGETGSSAPYGDGYDIDYVAHEMGHEFGGNHTFDGTVGSCGGGNRNAGTAYEVGSGTTIMAYAGICGTNDIQPHSDPYFHAASLDEITSYVASGGSCSVNTSTGNSVPVFGAGFQTSYTVAVNTPFTLTAGGVTDANGDALTYCWEDYDLGTTTTTKPLFRSLNPVTSTSRTFGNVANPTSGNTAWEALPTVARTLKFRCVVRDNRAGGGAIAIPPVVTVTVTTGGGCTYSISPTSASPGASATTGSVTVTTTTGCSWTAVSNNTSWLTVTSGASGTGNGTVNYSVAANTGAARQGTITIAGQTFTVNQAAGSSGCSSSTTTITSSGSGSLATTDCASTVRTGGTFYYDNFTFAAASGTTYTITLNSSAFDCYAYLLNGSTVLAQDDDGNGGTNSKITYTATTSGTFTIHCTSYSAGATGAYTVTLASSGGGSTTVLSEGAESGASGWTVTTNITGNNWVVSADGRRSGANGFRSNNATATYPNNLDQSLISPAFSLAGKTSASLTYYYKQQTESTYDFLKVEVSTNGGSTWTNISNVSTTSTGFTTTAGSGMVSKTLSLTTYAGQSNVKIRFRLTSDVSVVYWGAAIDDIAVTAQ